MKVVERVVRAEQRVEQLKAVRLQQLGLKRIIIESLVTNNQVASIDLGIVAYLDVVDAFMISILLLQPVDIAVVVRGDHDGDLECLCQLKETQECRAHRNYIYLVLDR